MAHKKAGGSTRNGRDSNAQYRGVKKFGGEWVTAGNIIVRQCGSPYRAGSFVGCGKDFTLYALADGRVSFGMRNNRRTVDVIPATEEPTKQ